MKIKGVNIQSEANYYKILSVIKNDKNITVQEVKKLDSYLMGKENKLESRKSLSENIYIAQRDKRFSAIRGIVHKESNSFFDLE